MSITRKISFLFIASFIIMTIIGVWIDSINSKRIDDLIKDKYLKTLNEILLNIDNQDKIQYIIDKNDLSEYDLANTKSLERLYYKEYTFGYIAINKEMFEDEFIIELTYLDDKYILKTPDEQNIKDKMILNFLIILDIIVLIAIFLYIFKLLNPLKVMTKDIKEFSSGNLNTRINVKSNDEIGTLAKTFNSMADSLVTLIKTREELLRDIGHELRTPITKGQFLIEKVQDTSQKESLKGIFKELNLLTSQLIELEKLNSDKLTISEFSMESLIVESLRKTHIPDESKIVINILDNFKIRGDIYYLSMAIKNLIDNALKYSVQFPIEIVAIENKLIIKNIGSQLSKDFEYYLKPFTRDSNKKEGFGLGLSIVNKIILKHKFLFKYSYIDTYNIFEIIFDD
ncbi:MAG: ArsS family sensor histidine kinase [Arcobacteraceae bacterium]|nr:ArsS family sensor histidine kinase [Arcobacteraceae bacterium]